MSSSCARCFAGVSDRPKKPRDRALRVHVVESVALHEHHPSILHEREDGPRNVLGAHTTSHDRVDERRERTPVDRGGLALVRRDTADGRLLSAGRTRREQHRR